MYHRCYCLYILVLTSWVLFSISVFASINVPIIIEPENNTVITGPNLIIKWQPLEEGQWCQIQVSEDPLFSVLLVDEDNIFSTEWTYEPLPQDGRKYYWRIRTRQHELHEDSEGEVSTLDAQARLLQEQFELSDINGDEQLSFDEANAVIQGLTEQQFNDLDQNGDGFLSIVELGGEDYGSGCCRSMDSKKYNIGSYIGDWLLIGLSSLTMMNLARKR